MALRMRSRDRSSEDYGEPSVTPDQNTSYGFPGLRPGYEHMPSSIGPHSDITQAMATAAGWPGPGLGPMPPKGINRPGQSAVPGVWSPGVGYGPFNPNAPVYSTQGNPMGYAVNTSGNPHDGGWGMGTFGGGYGQSPFGEFGGFIPSEHSQGAGNYGGGYSFGPEDSDDSDNYGGSG